MLSDRLIGKSDGTRRRYYRPLLLRLRFEGWLDSWLVLLAHACSICIHMHTYLQDASVLRITEATLKTAFSPRG